MADDEGSWFARKVGEYEPINLRRHWGKYSLVTALAGAFLMGRCSVDVPEDLSGQAVENIYPICNSGGSISLYNKIINGDLLTYNVAFDDKNRGKVTLVSLNTDSGCVNVNIRKNESSEKKGK